MKRLLSLFPALLISLSAFAQGINAEYDRPVHPQHGCCFTWKSSFDPSRHQRNHIQIRLCINAFCNIRSYTCSTAIYLFRDNKFLLFII